MNPLRAALVIARRDYVASVWSRTFLFFLIGPLLPLLAGGMFAAVSAGPDAPGRPAIVAVIGDPVETGLIVDARAELAKRLGEGALPVLRAVSRQGAADAQRRALLADPATRAVLELGREWLADPVLSAPSPALAELGPRLELIVDQARAAWLFAHMDADRGGPPRTRIVARPVRPQAVRDDAQGRLLIARFGQVVLMFLTVLLTGMMVSNMVEEKSNKVIEVLTAAVPVDGIFFGKLIAMLGLSLTGIAVWGGTAAVALALFAPGGAAALPVPAVGWAGFAALGLVYFAAIYLLLGAVFLGIGAQAGSVREVQTMSMPLTMAQLGVVAFSSSALAHPDGGLGLAASIFPWSSPYAMLARAAQDGALWPHAAAILWQAAWVALTIRLVSRWFRVSVLKSGRPGAAAPRWRRTRTPAQEV